VVGHPVGWHLEIVGDETGLGPVTMRALFEEKRPYLRFMIDRGDEREGGRRHMRQMTICELGKKVRGNATTSARLSDDTAKYRTIESQIFLAWLPQHSRVAQATRLTNLGEAEYEVLSMPEPRCSRAHHEPSLHDGPLVLNPKKRLHSSRGLEPRLAHDPCLVKSAIVEADAIQPFVVKNSALPVNRLRGDTF
jgi:hypothetical protein